jgi:hypothetical protein
MMRISNKQRLVNTFFEMAEKFSGTNDIFAKAFSDGLINYGQYINGDLFTNYGYRKIMEGIDKARKAGKRSGTYLTVWDLSYYMRMMIENDEKVQRLLRNAGVLPVV